MWPQLLYFLVDVKEWHLSESDVVVQALAVGLRLEVSHDSDFPVAMSHSISIGGFGPRHRSGVGLKALRYARRLGGRWDLSGVI